MWETQIAAMDRQCRTAVALLLLAPLVFGTVTAAGNFTAETVAGFEDASMITISGNITRPQARRLATTTVWCISIPNASDTTLQDSLDWVCGPLANQGQVNCGPINEGGACYEPNTRAHHCDWAFNTYFNRMNATADSCNFSGTAQQVSIDPSSGNCTFPGSIVTLNGTTPGSGPANSPLSPSGSPLSPSTPPSAAPAAWQPYHLFSAATAAFLLAHLLT